MPPTGGSTVQLTINVVDANSGQTIANVVRNLDQLGVAGSNNGKKLAEAFGSAGIAGEEAGRKGSKGMQDIGAHSLSALDNVRLLRDDLGIRIPRAMEKVIAQSQLMSGAIAAAGGAFVALGSAELLYHLGQEVYRVYENWVSTTKAVDDYINKAGEAARQKLFDSSSFDTQIALLQRAQTEVDRLTAKKRASDSTSAIDQFFLPHSSAPYFSNKDSKDLARYSGERDQANAATIDRTHQLALQNIDTAERLAKITTSQAAIIAATERAAHQRNVENMAYAQQLNISAVDAANRAHGLDPKKNPDAFQVDPNAGRSEYDSAEAGARAEARAQQFNLAREQEKELMGLRQQAQQAGLEGERLLQAQRIAALETLAQKYGFTTRMNEQYRQEEAAVNERFDKEELKRLEDQTREVRRRNDEANQRGLTGLAALDARAASAKNDIDDDIKRRRYYGNRDQQEQYGGSLKNAIDRGAIADQQKLIDDFTERIARMDDSRANSSISANQRIDAETRRTVAEIQKAWSELYGQLGILDSRRVQGQIALNAEIARIQEEGARQKAENTRNLEDETRKMEDEAGRLGRPREQEQTRAIVDEYNERIRKLEELRAKDADNADLYRRQEIAAEQIKNDKLLDQQRQMRDKLAGELRGFMSNPLEALKRQGEDIASKAAADLLMGHLPGSKNAPGVSTGQGGGVFDMLPFRPTFGRNGGVPGQVDPHLPSASTGAATANVSAGTATVNISSATVNGLGGAGGSASGNYVPTGNGGFFNVGGSGSGGATELGSPSSIPAGGGSPGGGLQQTEPDLSDYGVGGTILKGVGAAQSTYNTAQGIASDLGMKGSIASKVPGLNKLSDSTMSKLGGAAGGAIGLYSAFEGKGGWGGAASGALSGAKLGAEFGGPAGALVGAAVGAIVGAIGHGARVLAQKYWFRELQPKVKEEMLSFESGAADYQSVYDQLNSDMTEAKNKTNQMGPGAQGYYQDRIKPELQQYMQRLTREQKSGRSQMGMTAAQFHFGGMIDDFGSLATSNDEGFIHAKRGEVVLNEQAAMSHGDVAMMMNAGASRSDVASYLGNGPQVMPVQGGDVNLHFHSHDARGTYQLFMDNKHTIREALNSSYGENSGGADQ